MDPIILSTMTTALTLLGTEVAKATASEAGRASWNGVLKLFGWREAPAEPELAEAIAKRLLAEPELHKELEALLAQAEDNPTQVNVDSVTGHNVVVAGSIGNLNQNS